MLSSTKKIRPRIYNIQALDSIAFIKGVVVITQLKDLLKHLEELKNAGITIAGVIKQLFKDNKTDLPLQLIADIENFESKNDFELIKTAIEQYINNLP